VAAQEITSSCASESMYWGIEVSTMLITVTLIGGHISAATDASLFFFFCILRSTLILSNVDA
jgi:hypothetical protein